MLAGLKSPVFLLMDRVFHIVLVLICISCMYSSPMLIHVAVSVPERLMRAGADSFLDLSSPGCCCLSHRLSGVCLAPLDRDSHRTCCGHLSPYFHGTLFGQILLGLCKSLGVRKGDWKSLKSRWICPESFD